MTAPRENQTVGQLIARMRRMLGHLGAHDRQIVLEAIEAILEVSQRLYDAIHVQIDDTHPRTPALATRPSQRMVITRIEEPDESRGGTDL